MTSPIAIRLEQKKKELDLIRRAAGGDPIEQRRLLDRVMGRVRKTAAYLAGSSTEGEDLAQQVLVEVIRGAASFRGDSTLNYWVDRVTIQTAAKHFEKRDRRRKLRSEFWHPGKAELSVEDRAGRREIRVLIAAHLRELSPKQRFAIVLHYLYDYEVPEIAEMTHAKINTVRGRLRKGLKQIRQSILADHGLRDWIEEGMK
jgi:RNA polymerase sigma-70 factor (ECF subfamily)